MKGNPKDRYGLQKVPIGLFPISAIVYGALAVRDGCKKYGPYNWRGKPIRYSIFYDACQRHLLAHMDGEETAPDSGVPHLAHALACIAIIIDAMETGNFIDDRPPKGVVAKLLDRYKISDTGELTTLSTVFRPTRGGPSTLSLRGLKKRKRITITGKWDPPNFLRSVLQETADRTMEEVKHHAVPHPYYDKDGHPRHCNGGRKCRHQAGIQARNTDTKRTHGTRRARGKGAT